MKLTQNEKKILRFIKKYFKKYGIMPSFKEIGASTKLKSMETISRLVKQLEIKKEITIIKKDGKMIQRGIKLKEEEK